MPSLVELYLEHTFWVWMAMAAALLALEVATGSGWLLWPAAAAAITGVLAPLLHLEFPWALLLFAVLTIVMTLPARRYLPRSVLAHGHDINDNVNRLMGREGRVVSDFKDASGRVFIDGKEWAAELDEGDSLKAGARVEVTGVHGARLRVRGA